MGVMRWTRANQRAETEQSERYNLSNSIWPTNLQTALKIALAWYLVLKCSLTEKRSGTRVELLSGMTEMQ